MDVDEKRKLFRMNEIIIS